MIKLMIMSLDHCEYFGEVSLSNLKKEDMKFRDIQFFNYQDQKCYANYYFTQKAYIVKTHTHDGRTITNKFCYLDDLKNYIKRNYKR